MSLTAYLSHPDSGLSRFFEDSFPNRDALLKRHGLESPLLRVAPPDGINAGTVGTAFDFLLRFDLTPTPSLDLALMGAKLAGPTYVALQAELADRVGRRRQQDALPRSCYLAALFTEVYRSGAIWPGSLLSQVTKRTTLDQLLGLVPNAAVEDLEAMLGVAREVLVPVILARGGPLAIGPVFDGSRWVSADADIISAGLLLDVKTTVGTKRKDGSRYDSLDRRTLYQLLGYLLFDFSDAYSIKEIGLYSARFGRLTTWPVADVLAELASSEASLADLRRRCELVVRSLADEP